MNLIKQAAELINSAKYLIAFTGAGISVESGIPPFRGQNGIWNKYDPEVLELSFFKRNPKESWQNIKKMFFEVLQKQKPNQAHIFLSKLEEKGLLKSIITQNIDNLHYLAGNKNVVEFHGNTRDLICLECGNVQKLSDTNLEDLPPRCSKCNSVLKPDFVFFGENIPADAYDKSHQEVQKTDVLIVIGTSGLIYPASILPELAKQNGAKIIEINLEPSNYTSTITDVFLQGSAVKICSELQNYL